MSEVLDVARLQWDFLAGEAHRRFVVRLVYVAVGFATAVVGFVLGFQGYSGAVDLELGLGNVFTARLGNAGPGLVLVAFALIILWMAASAFQMSGQVHGRAPTPSARGHAVNAPGLVEIDTSFVAMRAAAASPEEVELDRAINVYVALYKRAHADEPSIDRLAFKAVLTAFAGGPLAISSPAPAAASKEKESPQVG